jgi:uncharacterized membrane protein
MPKPILGLILGALLGGADGFTAIFYPATAGMVGSIMLWSGLKGMIVGILTGFFAAKINSLKWTVIFGGAVAALFAYLVAMTPTEGKYYYAEIMIPGTIVGLILGWATFKFGRRSISRA